jgi:hypothetical protein
MKVLRFVLVFCFFLAMACTGQDETGGGGGPPEEDVPSQSISSGEALLLIGPENVEFETSPLEDITAESCGAAEGVVHVCDFEQFSTALFMRANRIVEEAPEALVENRETLGEPYAFTGTYYVKKGTIVNVNTLNEFLENRPGLFEEDDITLVRRQDEDDTGGPSKDLLLKVGEDGTCGKVMVDYELDASGLPLDVIAILNFDESVLWCGESYQELKWEIDLNYPLTAVELIEGRIYVGTSNGNVYAFDSEGKQVWMNEEVCESVVSIGASEKVVAVGCNGDDVYVLDSDTGKLIEDRDGMM